MKRTYRVGYWLLICAITVAAALYAWFKGAPFGLTPAFRVVVVLLIGAVLLLIEGLIFALLEKAGDLRGGVSRGAYRREQDSEGEYSRNLAASCFADLKSALRDRLGWRWRSRLPWLLLYGEPAAIDVAVPGLRASNWVVAPEAVLLYGGWLDEPDEPWLKLLRRKRLGRPVDAVIVIQEPAGFHDELAVSDRLAPSLRHQARILGWSAPVYLLNLIATESATGSLPEAIGHLWTGMIADQHATVDALSRISIELADKAMGQLSRRLDERYLAEISCFIDWNAETLAEMATQITRGTGWKIPVQGMLFAPAFNITADDAAFGGTQHLNAWWSEIGSHCRHTPGRSIGISAYTVGPYAVTGVVALWSCGLIISALSNGVFVAGALKASHAVQEARSPAQEAVALAALEDQIDTLEYRVREGAPWYSRFGLNRDPEVLERLWPIYRASASRVIVAPFRQTLEQRLRQMDSSTDQSIVSGGQAQVTASYRVLKTYLMMAKPEHADPAFLVPAMLALRQPVQQGGNMSPGAWRDVTERLITFYARHLRPVHPGEGTSPTLTPDGAIVASARQTLIRVIGLQNSTDMLYEEIINENRPKYPATTLQALLGGVSTQGLFSTGQTLPGVFTRAAWDERIGKAIDEADEQRTTAGDWVLTDARTKSAPEGSIRAALRERYFADFARAWEALLNSIRWEDSGSMSGAVDQLTLLADPQRSPLNALMDVIASQAQTGVRQQGIGDTLVNRAKGILGQGPKDSSGTAAQASTNEMPLAGAFGPLLRLGPSNDQGGNTVAVSAGNDGDVSLARYMQSVTAVRLKLQQILASPDPGETARLSAQAILQGKTSEIGDSRTYSDLVAASLGQEWSGFGEALFRRPIEQTWGMVLQPAAASLNNDWRDNVVTPWNTSFRGRYPFDDSDNDASLPEIARFVRGDTGVIAQFVTTQLGGVIERRGDRWVAVEGASRGALTVDPAFIAALNQLSAFANTFYSTGDARVRYELRAVPTVGLSEFTVRLGDSSFYYVNQKLEWSAFTWPGDGLSDSASLRWRTIGDGLRSGLEYQGRFSLIRLLERADVSQIDEARYLLSWKPEASQAAPLQLELRAGAGAGPLDMLKLRHFALPGRIFVAGNVQTSTSHVQTSTGRKNARQ